MAQAGSEDYVIAFEKLRNSDVGRVGGKNASLGEMISQLAGTGVRVPGGFATTAQAFRDFLEHDGLAARIATRLSTLDVADVKALGGDLDRIFGAAAQSPLAGIVKYIPIERLNALPVVTTSRVPGTLSVTV